MKVNVSQIPEDSGKPIYPEKKRKTVSSTPRDYEDEEDEDLDEDEEKQRYIRSMINFDDVGISMSLFGIESIEKDIQFVEKPKAHWEYGITINKGMTSSMRFPKVDVSVWFLTEKMRDDRWTSMLERLKKEGFNVIEV